MANREGREQTPFLPPVDPVDQPAFRPTKSFESHVRTDFGLRFEQANPTITREQLKMLALERSSDTIGSHYENATTDHSPPPPSIRTKIPVLVPTSNRTASEISYTTEVNVFNPWQVTTALFSTARR